jgi:peptidylprolyl isomerase
MDKVANGLFVSIDYTGTLDDGEIFDSSEGRQPLEIQIGAGSVLPGFESALMDMTLNDTKTFRLSADDAYGERDDSRMHEFPKSEIPPGMEPTVGQVLMLSTPQGERIPARVDSINEQNVIFDLNHPLAGQALNFKIKVVGINEKATQEHVGCGSHCSTGDCDCGDGGCA